VAAWPLAVEGQRVALQEAVVNQPRRPLDQHLFAGLRLKKEEGASEMGALLFCLSAHLSLSVNVTTTLSESGFCACS
jgi:hypothetical protein